MSVPIFHVNAFTNGPFQGNPAAVCPLKAWLDDELLLAVAAENNLSETAFFVPQHDDYHLRWFTPRSEVDLCGHATLASAFVLLTILEPQKERVRFATRSGILTVHREKGLFSMDFPALPPWTSANPPAELLKGLGTGSDHVSVVQVNDNYFVVYKSEDEVRRVRPDFELIKKLHPAGVGVTAPGLSADFVSRYFVPSYGIPEDPVTGSTHCSLAPYWSQRLGKTTLHAQQMSERGGELWCELAGERVILKGKTVLTLQGELLIG
jgi:PhzF family phenazine biosynthesis protein